MDDDHIKTFYEGGITLSMSSLACNDSFHYAIKSIPAFFERFENDDKLLRVIKVYDIYRAKKEEKTGAAFSL